MEMTDYEDYENNLAFPPEGDWADTEPKNNTDRTASTIELINEIEKLNKWLDLKSEYIEKLETKNKELKEQLDVKEAMIKNYTAEIETQRQQLAIAIEALKYYKQEHWTHADEYNYFRICEYTGGWCHAEKALEQIMGLDK